MENQQHLVLTVKLYGLVTPHTQPVGQTTYVMMVVLLAGPIELSMLALRPHTVPLQPPSLSPLDSINLFGMNHSA